MYVYITLERKVKYRKKKMELKKNRNWKKNPNQQKPWKYKRRR